MRIIPGYLDYAEGSALIELGKTTVLCAVTVENRIPRFLRGTEGGWVTAEYAMLPRATKIRTIREAVSGRVTGRTHEIQRLIGRCLRAVTDLEALGERTLVVDCDVLQADGGTRTAAVTGAYVALYQALKTMVDSRLLGDIPLRSAVAAVSVGIVGGRCLLDPCYEEDCRAQVDFNVLMTDAGRFVEVQGSAEGHPFSRRSVDSMLDLAAEGVQELLVVQNEAIKQL